MAIAYNNSVKYLIQFQTHFFARPLFCFYFPFLLLHQSHAHYLRFKPHKLINPELAREVLQIYQNLSVTREPSRVSVRVVFGDEWVVPEAHGLSGDVGAEGVVEARVDHGPS